MRYHSFLTFPLVLNEDDERTITVTMSKMTKEGPPAGTNAQNPIVVVTHSEQEVKDYVATMLSQMVRRMHSTKSPEVLSVSPLSSGALLLFVRVVLCSSYLSLARSLSFVLSFRGYTDTNYIELTHKPPQEQDFEETGTTLLNRMQQMGTKMDGLEQSKA